MDSTAGRFFFKPNKYWNYFQNIHCFKFTISVSLQGKLE